jgi:hypothetical protein
MSEKQSEFQGMNTWRFASSLDAVDPYQWFTILPHGKFRRFGRRVEITPEMTQEMVRNFRVMPPREVGVNREHMHQHGNIANIAALRSTPDGLQAIIGWFETGLKAVEEKAFQYFSVEVVFDEYDLDGKFFKNFLTGLAVTNDPYFGSLTAMFTATDRVQSFDEGGPGASSDPLSHSLDDEGEAQMVDESKVVDGLWRRFGALFSTNPEPAQSPAPATPTQSAVSKEDFDALQLEVTKLRAEKQEAERLAADAARSARIAKFAGMLGESMAPLAEKLALIEDEALAEDLAEQFRALAAQADEGGLFSEIGSAGGDPDASLDGADRFSAMVDRKVEGGMKFSDAVKAVNKEHPDLYEAHRQAALSKTKGR